MEGHTICRLLTTTWCVVTSLAQLHEQHRQPYLRHGLVMVIEAMSPLEVDAQGAVPVLGQGPAPLNGPHQPGHFHIALRASGLSWRATALVLSLCMNQVACSKEPPVPSLGTKNAMESTLVLAHIRGNHAGVLQASVWACDQDFTSFRNNADLSAMTPALCADMQSLQRRQTWYHRHEHMHKHMHKGFLQTDRLTDRQADSQPAKQTRRDMYIQMDKRTDPMVSPNAYT